MLTRNQTLVHCYTHHFTSSVTDTVSKQSMTFCVQLCQNTAKKRTTQNCGSVPGSLFKEPVNRFVTTLILSLQRRILVLNSQTLHPCTDRAQSSVVHAMLELCVVGGARSHCVSRGQWTSYSSQLWSGVLLKQGQKINRHHLMHLIFILHHLSDQKKLSVFQHHCRCFIFWGEWDISGTCPYNHKERISAVKDTLFIQKLLLLWRTHCSLRVICDEITSLQGRWYTSAYTHVQNLQTEVNKT